MRPRLPACCHPLALLLASASSLAEGNLRMLDCAITRACDAAGACEPVTGTVGFELSPQSTGPDGSGRVGIRYGGVSAAAFAQSEAGPFYWESGNERHTLVASSEVDWLWHRLVLTPAPSATIRFLSCRFQR